MNCHYLLENGIYLDYNELSVSILLAKALSYETTSSYYYFIINSSSFGYMEIHCLWQRPLINRSLLSQCVSVAAYKTPSHNRFKRVDQNRPITIIVCIVKAIKVSWMSQFSEMFKLDLYRLRFMRQTLLLFEDRRRSYMTRYNILPRQWLIFLFFNTHVAGIYDVS